MILQRNPGRCNGLVTPAQRTNGRWSVIRREIDDQLFDYGKRLHFGLGKRDHVDRIEVRWIGGGVDVVENVPVDRLVTVSEGSAK